MIPNAAQDLLLKIGKLSLFRLEQEMDITSPRLYEVMFANEVVRSPGAMITQNLVRDPFSDSPAWKKFPSGKALSADYTCVSVIDIRHKSPFDERLSVFAQPAVIGRGYSVRFQFLVTTSTAIC
jgi:hypothetical protein